MVALTADTVAAAGGGCGTGQHFAALLDGGGRRVAAALLDGRGGGLTLSTAVRFGRRRRGGLLAKSCGGRPCSSDGRARSQPSLSGTAARQRTDCGQARLQHFIEPICSPCSSIFTIFFVYCDEGRLQHRACFR